MFEYIYIKRHHGKSQLPSQCLYGVVNFEDTFNYKLLIIFFLLWTMFKISSLSPNYILFNAFKNVFNEYVLQLITSGNETELINSTTAESLAVAQFKIG